MNQEYIGPPRPPEPGPMPPGGFPAWYGWPPTWYCAAPAQPPAQPVPAEPPGGVRKLAYSVEEAAEALGVSRSLVYRLIHQRDFPSVKLRGRRVISAELLAEWMRAQAGGAFQ